MPKAYFLNAVSLCKTPGETNVDGKVTKAAILDHKQPNTIADVSKDDYDSLLDQGAIRAPTADELKLASGREPTAKRVSAAAIADAEAAVNDATAKVAAATDDASKVAANAELSAAQTTLAALKG